MRNLNTYLFTAVLAVHVFLLDPAVFAVCAAAQTVSEAELKSGFVLNFIRLTEFPSTKEQIRLCVEDGAELYEVFKQLDGKLAEGVPVYVSRAMQSQLPCDVLYFSGTAGNGNASSLIEKARHQPMLLVGETPGFLTRGGIINFFMEDGKLRFEVNMRTLQQSGLKLSSRLLNLAKIVDGD